MHSSKRKTQKNDHVSLKQEPPRPIGRGGSCSLFPQAFVMSRYSSNVTFLSNVLVPSRTMMRLHTYSNPLSSAVSPSSAVNGSLSSSEMISILRRSASNPMLHINGMDGFCIFICFSRRISMRCFIVFRININTERRRIVDMNSSTCGTSNCAIIVSGFCSALHDFLVQV